ncbi:MAG: electron transporter RnfC, partial [Tenericutes bacterium HGW-Tenericutes-3]
DKKYELHESISERTDEEIDALTKEAFIEIVKEAGLVGLGGSAFPTYIKLDTKDPINVVIANGVECEPNLIADYGLMMNNPREVIKGLIYAMKASGAPKGVIAIKKKYIEIEERLKFVLQEFTEYDIKVVKVGNHYPQGWELEMIKNALGIKIPQGELLSKYGVLNFNVSTLQSIYNAVKKRLPVLERLFTISGNGVNNSSFRARIGTQLPDLIELAGGYKDIEIPKVLILGGPMMGTNVTRDDIVMTHTSTSLIVLNEEKEPEEPCIHCASCVYSCPVSIQPTQIMSAYKAKDKDTLKMLDVNKCIECGLCSFVCPSKIHLTEYMRLGKRFANR